MRQSGKSLAHLQIQLHLKSLIAGLTLEKRLHRRIADAHWEQEKIVFEIQCSPLSLEEARERSEDYLKMGIAPVWILHDRQFNRRRLSPAEKYLRSKTTAVFTDGNTFYDQFDICSTSKRLYRGPKLPVDLTLPRKTERLSFQGDFLHWAETHDTSHFKKMEKQYLRPTRRWKAVHRFLLYRLLENCTL